ncbi:hypothetical protein EF879_06145 [Micromonospora sp. HM5-17]|nr:hypothetical protein EF879_06145 [Micromonospora sp. HM5-17]
MDRSADGDREPARTPGRRTPRPTRSGPAATGPLWSRWVPTAVLLVGAVYCLHRAGRRVPEDVAVGGFDDSKVASTPVPRLTTIRQPWARLSAEMVRLLLGHLAGESYAAVILPAEPVIRGSA